jgi:hypothetical protein
MYCDILGFLREARAAAQIESEKSRSRELSLVLTKIDEALLWRQEDMRLKAPIVNECGIDPAES